MPLIPFEEGLGITPEGEPQAAAPAAGKKLIPFEEGLGIPYPKKDPSLLGAVTDSGFWKGMGSRFGTGALAIGDMVAGIPGQALTVGADLGVRTYALATGQSRRITDMAAEEAHAMIPQELSMPLQTLNKLITGAEPADQSGINDAIDAAAGALEKVTKNKISAGGAKSLLNTFMLVGGAKAGDAIIQQALTKADVKLPNARASYQAAETPEASPVEPKGGPLDVMDSKAKVNELFKKAKQGGGLNVPDATAVNEMFNRVRRGEDAPREPVRGQPPVEVIPPDPNRIGAQAGEVPKTRLTDPTIIGEEAPKPYSAPDIESALSKVQNGQGFSLTAEERISLTKLKQDAKGRFVDQYGKPLVIAAATAAALSQLDDLTDEQKVMGVLGATMVPKEARAWGKVSEALRPSTFSSLEGIAKEATEIPKAQIEQRLKDPKIPEAERAMVQKVLEATPGEKIFAADLAEGLYKETNGLTLENSKPKASGEAAAATDTNPAIANEVLPDAEKAAPRITPFVGPKQNAPTTLASAGLANELAYKMTPEVERATIAQFRDNPAGSPAREKAATALYNENHRQVARAINSYAKAGIDLEEIVQHSFVKAFRTLEQKPEDGGFRGDSRFSTYLHTIATNLAKNAYKRGNPLKLEELTDEHADLIADPQARTPLQELQNKTLASRMQRAIDRLPDEFRETFTMKELEGMSNQEIAQKLGIPEGTVASRLSRATQRLQKDLREFSDGQSGKADPRVVAGIAALGGGAAAGAWLSDSEPLRGAMYGTLIGAALGTSGGRTLLKNVIKSPDTALGLISTRLKNIDPSLRLAIVKHEKSVLQNLDRTNDQIFPFIKALDDLPKGVSEQVSRALLNGDLAAVNAVPELRVTYPAVAKALGEIKGELQALNRFGEGVVDYFPRLVKDLEGLKKHLGTIYSEGIEKALLAAEASMIKKEGRPLTDVEQSLVVNRFLFASDRTAFQPGYAKGRKIEEITPDLQKYYEPPTESLLRYVSGALTDIQTAKFFGKDLATRKQGGKSYNDVDGSIGNLVARLQREGNLTREQGVELRDILKARFEGGDKGMSPVLAHARNLTNTALLGNIASAATQLGDSLLTVYHHGAVPTIQAVAQRLIGQQKITAKQLGLINHVAEELAGQTTTGAVLQKMLKYSGFMAIDMFAKGLNLNAGLIKNTKLAQTAAGQQILWDRYGRAFGDEMPQLIEDLKARRMSDNVETLAFSEISDAQPISKAEMPEAYLAHPNGRILYQLKTYMLKQVDIVRRDAYQKIATGEPSKIMEGAKNLAALAAVYALANVPGDVVKDILSGRDIDPFTTPQIVDNVLQTFGLNRYTQDSLSKGKVVETAQNLLTPPVKVFQDVGKTVNSLLSGGSDYKGASYIPLAGRPVYERYLGGNERKEIAETRLANSKLPKEERKTLSPEAKEYLRKKRLERTRDAPYESPAEKKQRATQARIDKRARGEGK